MSGSADEDHPLLEARFERRVRAVGLIAGPLCALLVYLWNPGGHEPPGRRLLAVLGLTIAFWVTEAIPLPATALLASALAIVLGVAPVRDVLAPYADPVIFLFIGSFLLAEAFVKYGLDRRIAMRLVGRGRLSRSRVGRMSGLGGVSALLSTCLSNTATAALMTPIALGAVSGDGRGAREGAGGGGAPPAWVSGVLLMVAYGASIGGMATLIGTPPNLLGAGFIERLCHVRVGFVPWLLFGLPIALAIFAMALLWMRFALGRWGGRGPAGEVDAAAAPRPPAAEVPAGAGGGEGHGEVSRAGARATVAAFLAAAVLWIAPSLTALILGKNHPLAQVLDRHLPEAGVALLCGAALFVVPVSWRRRRFALSWEEGRRVNWGVILLFGGGLSLGTLAEATGVAAWVGGGLRELGIARTGPGLLLCAIALAIVVTEFASNTATTSLLVPVVIATAQAAGLDPVAPALGATLGASCAFVFPVSTPPNAIVFGTGLVPLRRMIRAGALLDLASIIILWGALLVLSPLLPH